MPLGVVVTDLDGTLLDSRHQLGECDRRTLEELGRLGVLRVVATGRSLYSALGVLPEDIPIDYLCHSSGAGVLRWSDRCPLRTVNMPAEDASTLARELVQRGLDFMLHFAIPSEHHFYVHRVRKKNPDFDRRLQRFAEFSSALPHPLPGGRAMSRAIVIEPPPDAGVHAELELALPSFQVIRATSPIDGASTWVELYPRGVNKASAAAWLWESIARPSLVRVAIGNDYNDLDLLAWADLSFVVSNAPAELCARYPTVPSNDAAGFSEAVRRALATRADVQ
jgi:hydroxymethylpyrimidine pyrophosphatase-like HAD family hydrolase